MLESTRIARRQSEIRQSLAELSGQETLTDETRSKIDVLDREYGDNERRFRAALISEEHERREAGEEMETRAGAEWSELMAGFEVRQVVLNLDEGRALSGRTAEVVEELRAKGGFRGTPIPYEALETRTGETIAAGVPDPVRTMPIIDRLFAESVASRMGASIITIDSGAVEWPVAAQGATAAWQATETGNVGGPAAYQTVDRPLLPNHTLGVAMRITRRSLKQSGAALETAVRRDMAEAIRVEMDKAVFQGSGSDGQPLGVISGAGTYGITVTPVDAAASYAMFREALARFMTRNAITSPSAVRALVRPELWAFLDGELITGTATSEYDRLLRVMPAANMAMSPNALGAPVEDTGESSLETEVLLATSTGGVAPIYVGLWGALDVVRDPFSDAQSGGLRITGLATMDTTISRTAQLELLTGVDIAAGGA